MSAFDDYGDDQVIDDGESANPRGFDFSTSDYTPESYDLSDLAVSQGNFGSRRSRGRKIATPDLTPDLSEIYPDPAVVEEPSPQDERDQMLSRRARIRQQILAKDGQKYAPEDAGLFTHGLLGLGEGTFSGLEGLAGTVEALTGSRYARKAADAMRSKASEFSLDVDPDTMDAGDWARAIGSGVASILTTVLGGLAGGLPGALMTAAAQQGGSTFRQARDAYVAKGLDERTAHLKALPIGIISGGITAALTAAFPEGAESIRHGMTGAGMSALVKSVAKGAGGEFTEEGLDQVGQGILEKLTYNPDKTIGNIVQESLVAAVAGGVVGGGVHGLREAAGRAAQAINPAQQLGPVDRRTMEQAVPFEDRNADLPAYSDTGDNAQWNGRIAQDKVIQTPSGWLYDASAGNTAAQDLVGNGLLSQDEALALRSSDPIEARATKENLANRLEALGLEGLLINGQIVRLEDLRSLQPGQPGQTVQLPAQQTPAPASPSAYPAVTPTQINSPTPSRVPATSRLGRNQNYALGTIEEPTGNLSQYQQVDEGRQTATPGSGDSAVNLPPVAEEEAQIISTAAQSATVEPKGGVTNEKRIEEGRKENGRQEGLLSPSTLTQQPVSAPPNAEPAVPTRKTKAKEQHVDAIQTLKDLGITIRGKKTLKAGTEGYYTGDYEDAITRNSLKPLFRNDGQGMTPDDAKAALIEHGTLSPDASVDDFWQLLLNDASKRKSTRAAVGKEQEALKKSEQQRQSFEELAFQNRRNASAKSRARKEAIPVDSLIFGDELKIGGEKFTVSGLHFNADNENQLEFVELSDGKKYGVQVVGASQVIYPDGGTYKPANVEFLPESNPQNGERVRELLAKKKLSPTEADELAALEKESGQQTIPGTEQTGRRIQSDEEIAAQQQKSEIAQRQGARLAGPDLRTQQGLFEPTAEEQSAPLFNQRQASIDQTEKQAVDAAQTGTVDRAEGTKAIRALIHLSKIPANVKQVILSFLDQPVMRELDWTGLVLEMKDFIDKGVAGARLGRIIELTKNADAATFPHEIAHILFDFLPADYKAAIGQARAAAIKDQFGDNPPAGLVDGTMQSAGFRQSGLDADVYSLINDSEFLATFVGEKFSKSAFQDRNGKSLWSKIREWFSGLVDAVRRTLGLRPSMEQIYREMLAGKWKIDLKAASDYQAKQFTYSYDANEAFNAARLAKTATDQQIEASHQLAQGFDIVEFLNKHGAGAIQYGSKKLLRYLDYLGIRTAGEGLNGGIGEGYRQLKARITDPFQRTWLARLAGQQVANLEGTLKDVIARADAGFREITGKTFIRKLAREARAKLEKNTADMINRVSGAIFNSAHSKAVKALEEESLSDLEIARLKAQLDSVDAARKSSSAMSQLTREMVDTLNSTPEGQQLLNDPNFGNRSDIVEVYKDITRSTGGTLRNDGLLSWAAFILRKNTELRDLLQAAYLASQSPIRAAMSAYETKFLADFQKNPIGTIRREFRAAQKRQSEYDRARFAWLTINKEVTDAINKYVVLQDAANVATGVLNDPDWKSLRQEIATDREQFGTQKPFEPFTDKTVLLPDGRELDVDTERVVGSKTEFARVRNRYEQAIQFLQSWLNNPANANDPNYQVHERNLATVTHYFYGLDVLRPTDNTRIWGTSMTMIQDAINVAGGRVAALARKSMASWNDLKRKTGWWTQEWSQKLSEHRIQALKSHGYKWGAFSGRSEVEVNNEWYNKVGRQLFYSHSRQQGGLKVGDLLSSGEKVTQEDFDELKNVQATAGGDIFKIIRDHEKQFPTSVQTTQDSLGGATTFRRALKGAENMVTRVFNLDLQSFGSQFVAAQKAKSQPDMIRLLNQYWSRIGHAFVWDRNADFAKNTPFDGPGGTFEIIDQRMSRDPNYVSNFDELVKEVSALSAFPASEVEPILLAEFGRLIGDWAKESADEKAGLFDTPRGTESKNFTTRSRNKAVAPYVFYDYGFKNTHALAQLGGRAHSRALDTMVAGLDALYSDLKRQQSAFEARAAEVGRKAALAENRAQRATGETYDRWKDLEKRASQVATVLEALKKYNPEQNQDSAFRRTVAATTGLLISGSITTAYNFLSGPIYLGWIANRIHSQPLWNYPAALWYLWFDQTLARIVPSFGYGLLKSGARLPVDVARAGYDLVFRPNRSAGKFFDTAFRNVILELGSNVYNRVEHLREMQKNGLLALPDFTREFDNRMLGGMLYQGMIPERELSTGQKILQAPAMVMEALLAFTKTTAPTLGDVALNAGVDAFFNSKVGPINQLESRLRKLFTEYKKSGYRLFNFTNVKDPVNLLSKSEVFPRTLTRFFPGEANLEYLREEFNKVGMSFDEEAARFLGELAKGNVQARFLSPDQRTVLNNKFIDYVNRSSAVKTPLALRTATWINTFISPFMFWKTRMLSAFLEQMAVPETVGAITGPRDLDRKRIGQAAFLLFAVVFPMVLAAAANASASNEVKRLMSRWLYNLEPSIRQPWERDGAKSQAIGWAINAGSAIPFLDVAVNAALNDMPTRASLDPNLVVIEKMKSVAEYFGGAIQTGDPTFRLPELIAGFVPDTKIVLNRLESQEGKREGANAVAIIRRKAPMEMIKPPFGGATGPSYTELSPYGPMMENAAMRGDIAELVRLHDAAAAKASEMGRADPEKAATQAFMARNPFNRALRHKMTDAQREQFMATLSPYEAQIVQNVEAKFEAGAEALGANYSPTKEERESIGSFAGAAFSRRGRRRISGRRLWRRVGANGLSRRARRRF